MNHNEHTKNEEGFDDFALPNHYFERSAQSILYKIEWQEEHTSFPFLFSLKSQSHSASFGFDCPFDFFDKSEGHLELLDLPVLQAITHSNSFLVPVNYFEESEITELEKILHPSDMELVQLKTLQAINKKNVFEAQADYFKKSESQLFNLLSPAKEARVIPFYKKRTSFAAAALLLIALGIYMYTQMIRSEEMKDCGTMACLDRKDLLKTPNLENIENEDLYELIDAGKLEQKLNEEKGSSKEPAQDSSLKDVSTEDLLDEI